MPRTLARWHAAGDRAGFRSACQGGLPNGLRPPTGSGSDHGQPQGITNLTTQDEQVECFRNAARHLRLGGTFLIENYVPELRRLPPGEHSLVFTATPSHIGAEESDVLNQIGVSRHWWTIDGDLRTFSSPHRYVWPSELDLMARLAGLRPSGRWSDWDRSRFTGESRSHISTWEKVADQSPGW